MGLSGDDIRRMAPWAQEQIAAQLVNQKHGVPECFRGTEQRTVVRAGPYRGEPGNKYHAKKAVRVMPNGKEHFFDSQAEARRYDGLYMLERQGVIKDLRLQVTFTLQESYIASSGERIRAIKYVADFTYYDFDGEYVVEDVKSAPTRTRVFEMNRKLMAEKFGIIVKVVNG